MNHDLQLTLSFTGNESDKHEIDLYDVSQALIGFQRSIALTTHLVLNDEIITQSPSLKGASIYALPAKNGSWEITAGIILTGLAGAYKLGTAPTNTPIGHLIHSIYDYVVSKSLGFHVDYKKSLGQLNEEYEGYEIKLPQIRQSQADSLIEKCTTAIKEMHRPIYKTGSATGASITTHLPNEPNIPIQAKLTHQSYEYIHEIYTSEDTEVIAGHISSYNSNTYNGRIYIKDIGRPVSFKLLPNAKNYDSISLITNSLDSNAVRRNKPELSLIYCYVYKNNSKSGYLKSVNISHVTIHDPR